MPSVRLTSKRRYRRTFDLYVSLPALSFADCYHAAYMESQGLTDLVSFDREMDRVATITRKEPDAGGELWRTMEREPDAYWHDDRALGEVYFDHADWLVRARSSIEDEVFRGRDSETLFTLTERDGRRTYIQSRLYINARPGTSREQRVADAQAWYYPDDRTAANRTRWRPRFPRPVLRSI